MGPITERLEEMSDESWFVSVFRNRRLSSSGQKEAEGGEGGTEGGEADRGEADRGEALVLTNLVLLPEV